MKDNWIAHTCRKLCPEFHVKPHVKSIADEFDAVRYAAMLKRIGCKAVLIEAVDEHGNSQYDTSTGLKHPHLSRNLYVEYAEAVRKAGIKIICYYNVLNPRYAELHPEWAARKLGPTARKGKSKILTTAPVNYVCLNSAFMETVFLPDVQSAAALPQDAFFFDFLYSVEPCFCDNCQRKFSDYARADIPINSSNKHWPRYLEWLALCREEVRRRAFDAIHAVRPGLPVGVNWGYSAMECDPIPDDVTYLTADVRERRNVTLYDISLNGRLWATSKTPYELMTTRMQCWWGDYSLKPVAQMQQEAAAVLSVGATTHLGDSLYPDGRVEQSVMKCMKEVFDFIKERERFCTGNRLVSDVGVLHTARSMYFTAEEIRGIPQEVVGANKLLVDIGCNHVIVGEQSLEDQLKALKLIILPDQRELTPTIADRLKSFVASGGTILATGLTSIEGNQRLTLADVFGVSLIQGSPHRSSFMRCNTRWLTRDVLLDMPVMAMGETLYVRSDSATAWADLCDPVADGGYLLDPPGPPTGYPAVCFNKYRGGRAVYIPTQVFRTYLERNTLAIRRMIQHIIDRLIPDRQLRVRAPATVEASLCLQGNKLVIHLVNRSCERAYPSAGTASLAEHIPPVREIDIDVAPGRRISHVHQEPERRKLAFEKRIGRVRFTVPELRIHSCIIIE